MDNQEKFLEEFSKYLADHRENPSKKDSFEFMLLNLCESYIDYFNDFNYEFTKNGESFLLQRLSSLPLKTIFDVGANIGDWSLTAQSYFPNAKFHTFEIAKTPFNVLDSRLIDNNFVKNQFGLSDANERIEYRDFREHSGVNSCLIDFNYHPFKSELQSAVVMRGDYYCESKGIHEIDFLKIDVEGYEPKVLNGFSGMLEKQAIRIIQFEYGYVNGDAKFLMKDFYNFFHKYEYIISKVSNKPFRFIDFRYKMNDFKSGPNYIAVRKKDEELLSLLTT